MHRHFEDRISECKARLVHMGTQAERMIDKAIQRAGNIQTSQELLNEIYKQRIGP